MELFCYFNLIVCMCVRVRACLRSVIIEIGYGLHERGSLHCKGSDETFSLRHRVQTSSGARPASYPMANMGSFSGGKAAGA
jgi:hypothetical protein